MEVSDKMKSNKILFITRYYGDMIGGTVCSDRNQKSLEGIYDEVIVYKINNKSGLRLFISILMNLLFGFMGSLDFIDIYRIIKLINHNNIHNVFIDGSLLGLLCKIFRLYKKDIFITTFFHNAEYKYIECVYSGIKRRIYLHSTKISEKSATKYSDRIITLNERDKSYIKKIYGRVSDINIPISINDIYMEEFNRTSFNEKYILFVGSFFPPNAEGIMWFIENVLPYIEIKLYIVGKNMNLLNIPENQKDKINIFSNVKDLSLFYKNATMMVMPIFKGSGMKVKTAEALMYGKFILGTDEAFEGYEIDKKYAIRCNSAKEFIESINENYNIDTYNRYAREVFIKKYSFNATLEKFKIILHNTNNLYEK